MIMALDGPAGSGKSTIAREVAKRLGLRYLDTGAMYRAVTLLALERGLVPDRIAEAGALAKAASLRLQERENDLTRVFVDDREITEEIRGRLVTQNVSAVSADPEVRAVLTAKQREEAAKGDVILEGRDMGTVVVPDADVKVFLTASIEERARRRQLQLQAQGVSQSLEELIADITARDAYDSGRALAPLRKADDAIEIDTTGMTIDEVVTAVVSLAESKGARCHSEAADRSSAPPIAAAPVDSSYSGGSASAGGSTAPAGASAAGGLSIPAADGSVPPAPGDPRWGTKWPLCRMVRGPLDTWLYRFAYSFIPATVRLLYRMEITGAENIPSVGAVVLASNHRSNLDPFFLGSAFPRMIHFMAKAELWRLKPLGWLIEKVGAFPVNRGEADRRAVRSALDVLAAGAVLGLFPEGHRQREADLGEIRAGVTMFSLREGVTTVPVILRGTDRVVRGRLPRFPRVKVAFGPPVTLPDPGLPRSQRSALAAERLVDAFRDLLSTTSSET